MINHSQQHFNSVSKIIPVDGVPPRTIIQQRSVSTFMTKRTKTMYEALGYPVGLHLLTRLSNCIWNSLDLKPRNVSTNYERAAITGAFNKVFPDVMVTGCYFHLVQSVLRKVNELGLKSLYNSDQEFALHVNTGWTLDPTQLLRDGMTTVL